MTFRALYAAILVSRLFVSGVKLFVCVALRLAGDPMWTARKCPTCATLWPPEYEECVQCGVKCALVNQRPMPLRQARSRESAILFERAYQEREDERVARGEPSPEELGREQAEADLAEIRSLEDQLRG